MVGHVHVESQSSATLRKFGSLSSTKQTELYKITNMTNACGGDGGGREAT